MKFSRVTAAIVAIALVAAACSSNGNEQELAGFGTSELLQALEGEGVNATIQDSPYPRQDIPSGTPELLCINGREANVYVYPTSADRVVEASDGPPERDGVFDLYWGTFTYWGRGEILVEFHNDPDRQDDIVDVFIEVLGPPLGNDGGALGDPPEQLPLSENCPAP
ncbi:MAG: hypothetical protein BMS9Abin17_1402 [Acidimicrobiia bacterium]|nr:MAG: hypothetical protein BMS9Abin17_1402 [Acidimicrobiia bacterium]